MIGTSLPKLDARAIVSGEPVYTDDIPLPPSALTVKILRSPHAHAKIREIECAAALKLPGVAAVFTYRDVPQIRYTSSGKSYPESSPYDRLLLEQEVRYVGDEVAIVAAETEEAALRALAMIHVVYEPLPALLDAAQAEHNEIVVHTEPGLIAPSHPPRFEPESNVISQFELHKGDIDRELGLALSTLDATYHTQQQAHCMMETLRASSYLDSSGRLVVIASTQVPFHARRQIARALGISVGKVRVIKPRVGGGFGGKTVVCVEPLVAFVTLRTGRPARLVYTRRETFEATSTRHAMQLRVRLGADADGHLRALRVDNINNTGAYGEDGAAVTMVAANNILPTYNRADAICYVGKTVYTHTAPAGALRGYGATQSAFAIECAINELAWKLGMDPIEFRLKNMARPGDAGGILHSEIKSCRLAQCIERGRTLIGWDEKYPCRQISPTKVRALGMSITTHRTSIPNVDKAAVTVRLEDDATFLVLSGAADIGTGADTILAQLAAQALNVPMERIAVQTGDTDSCPYDSGAYASSTTYVTGNAVLRACASVRKMICAAGARLLEVPADAVVFDGQTVAVAACLEQRISLQTIATKAQLGTPELIIASETYGSQLAPLPFAAGFAEIELDLETGKYDLTNFTMVIDCGKVINPALARVQAEGGAAMGIGLAMFEEVHYDASGRLLTNSFLQYKIPCRGDLSGPIQIEFIESDEPSGPYGAKSLGEVVVHTPAPAIAHALFNAGRIRLRELPMTPEKVWQALRSNDRG